MRAASEVFLALLNSLWQAALITAMAWAVLRFARRINAATRYAIWWAVLGVVIALPAAPLIAAKWRTWERQQTEASPANSSKPTRVAAPISDDQTAIVILPAERAARWPMWIAGLWGGLWIGLCVYRVWQIGRSYFYLTGVKRRARKAPAEVAPLPLVGRPARLLLSSDVGSPMAVGFLHPAVILPESLPGELASAEMEHVLLHESAHLARRDDWTNLLAKLLGAGLALHPVAWFILRQVERDREMACDDWVVARIGSARPYAQSLAKMSELRWLRRQPRRDPQGEALAAGIFGSGSRLGERIEELLRRGRAGSACVSNARVIFGGAMLMGSLAAAALAPRVVALAAERVGFEVASIKPGDPNAGQFRMGSQPGGRFVAENASLESLIQMAYDVRSYQISGGPNWLDSEKFTIDARPGSATLVKPGIEGIAQMRRMIQTLLEDRFRLAVRRETRQQSIYELAPSKGGPKLKEAEARAKGQGSGLRMGRGQITGIAGAVPTLADVLSQFMRQSVVDRSGFTGKYDFVLKWTPDQSQFVPPGAEGPAPPPDGPSIFTAVQEQLGLELRPAKGPVEMLVIDHAEKPSGN